MPHPAIGSLKRTFHADTCTITDPPRSEDGVWDEVTLTVTYPEPVARYAGPCVLDERSGVRREEGITGRFMVQGGEVRIVDLPDGIEVGQRVVIDRFGTVEFEIRELSAGTNELTTTLLVERINQLPPAGAA